MCYGEWFWKRMVVFGLTFGLGVFVAGLFISKQMPTSIKPMLIAAPPENKNCVPVDKSLKYETLEGKTPTRPSQLGETTKPEAKKPEDKKKSLKSEKQNNPAAPRSYDPAKDSVEVKNLLHKERCFETQAP